MSTTPFLDRKCKDIYMSSRHGKVKNAGFSLVELLAVIAIIALLTAGTGQAISALISSGGANQNISQLSGILEQAREYAVSQNTYVWVTFYSPAAATNGVKQVSVAVVASTDGTDPAAVNGGPSWEQQSYGTIPSSGLALVNKVVTFKQVSLKGANELATTPSSLPTSPSVQDPTNSLATNTSGYFSIQIPGTSGTAQFTQAVEFTPSGQARNSSSPVDVIDVDVQPQKGAVDDTKNVAVLRLNGLTGETAVYRQ
jgi:prepilin-type N-terminal cleavage/methylation domain-containing protein